MADSVVSEASHSTTKGTPSSMGRAADSMSPFSVLKESIASLQSGYVKALDKGWIFSEKFGINLA